MTNSALEWFNFGTGMGMATNFRYRILVVDDDEWIRRVSDEIISRFGYEVRTASDGFEALAFEDEAEQGSGELACIHCDSNIRFALEKKS